MMGNIGICLCCAGIVFAIVGLSNYVSSMTHELRAIKNELEKLNDKL